MNTEEKTTYSIVFMLVHSELDNYEKGCNPSTAKGRFLETPIAFEAPTLKELFKEIKIYFNVSQEALILNSGDEIGRLDVQTYSLTLDGLRCSNHKKRVQKKFKSGKLDLWLNDISGHVTKTTTPDLKWELKNEN